MMSVQPKVLVAIVSYNKKDDTLRCLESVARLDYQDCEVLVIDNGSTDGSVEGIKKEFPKAGLVELGQNIGATGGRNIAIDRVLTSRHDYVFFLDNDAVADPKSLAAMVELAESDSRIAAVGAKVYYGDAPGKIWYFGSRIQWLKGRFKDSCQGEVDDGRFEAVREVDTFPIGFGIVRADVIRKIGKIDDDYFVYFEESDWQLRMKRLGYKLMTTPAAKIWHHYTSPSGGQNESFYYYRNRNQLLFMFKNAPKRYLPVFMAAFVFDFLYDTALTLYLSKKYPELKAACSGVADFFRGVRGKRPASGGKS